MFEEAGYPSASQAAPTITEQPVHQRRLFWSAAYGAVIQIALMGGLFALYRFGRVLGADKAVDAFNNAEELWHVERWLHLPSEATVQRLTLGAHWLIEFANRYYVAVHFPITIGVLLWLYARHRDHYRWARAVIIGASVPALFIQVGIPVAPPRMMTHHGILDTMAIYGPTAYPANHSGIANQFAALPSLHVGWAVLLAVVAWRMRHRVARVILTTHAAITTWVVLVTGNHYWLDAFLGVALVAIAVIAIRNERVAALTSVTSRQRVSRRSLELA